jgi:hypothetical protein
VGFSYQLVRYAVECHRESTFFFPPDRLHILVCPPRPVFLQVTTPVLVFASPMVELVARPEHASRGDGKVVHAKINPKNRSVLIVTAVSHSGIERATPWARTGKQSQQSLSVVA